MANAPVFDPKADSPLSDTALKEKKERYAHFDAHTVVPRIIEEALGTEIQKCEPLGTGANAFDHLVYRIVTTDQRTVVCRISTDSLVAKYFLTEAAVLRAWKASGIGSPEVYAVSLRSEPEGYDYMILEYFGTDLEKHLKFHPEEALQYAHKSGAYLVALHTVPVSGFGMLTLRDGTLAGEQATWKEAVLVRLDETLDYLLAHTLLTKEQVDAVRQTFIRQEALLALMQGVTLHGDYHHANILIDGNTETIAGAVDLSQAKAGDPLYDIAFYGTYVSPETFDAFCNGYFGSEHRPDDFEMKIALYQLRIYLSKAKLRKRFGYDERIPAAIEGIQHSLAQLV